MSASLRTGSLPNDVHLLRLEGEQDAFTAGELRERLHGLIDGDVHFSVLVVDLEAVTFLDSTILGLLVGARRRMRERGGEVQLVYPVGTARRIFELTGLDAVLDLYEELPVALSGASA
jgi:anti-sigma B factor antagonist